MICRQNFRKWATDYRVWIVGIFLLILVRIFTRGITELCRMTDTPVTPWIFPLLFTGYNKLLLFLPLLLLFCNAPFIDDNQPYILIRSGRSAWCAGQILYILAGTGLYFLFMILATILFHLPHMTFEAGWGKVLNTLTTDAFFQHMEHPAILSKHIVTYFTPPVAMWYSFFLSWLAGSFLGLLMYVVNFLTHTRGMGVFAAAFFLLADAAYTKSYIRLPPLPVSWCSLDYIDIGGTTYYPSISFVLIGYAVLIGGLIALAFLTTRRQTIDVLPQI